MSERDRMRAKALEYARSQGWTPPRIAPAPDGLLQDQVIVQLQAELAKAEARVAELALAEERYKDVARKLRDQVTELERRLGERAPHLRKRITTLEGALRDLLRQLPERDGNSDWHAEAAHAREVLK